MIRLVHLALLALLLLFAPPARAQNAGLAGLLSPTAPPSMSLPSPAVTNWTFFTKLFTAVTTPIQSAVNAIDGALAGWVNSWFVQAAAVVLICLCLLALLDAFPSAYGWLIGWGLRAGGVMLVAASAGAYNQWVAQPLLGLPGQLAPLVTGATGVSFTTGGQVFDQSAMAVWTTAVTLSNNYNTSIFHPITLVIGIGAVLIALAAILMIAACFAAYLATYVLLDLIVAVGPIFVATLLAQVARSFFTGWLGTAASQVVALLLITTLLGITFSVIQSQTGAMLSHPPTTNTLDDLGALGVIAAALLVLAMITWHVSKIAIAMVGGVAMEWVPAAAAAAGAVGTRGMALAGRMLGSGSGGGATGGGASSPVHAWPPAGTTASSLSSFPGRSLSAGGSP